MVRLSRPLAGMSVQGACTPCRGSSSGGPSSGVWFIAAGERRSGQTIVQSSDYWSATSNANNATNAWNVDFNNGNVNNDDKSNDNNHAWCVRGGA